MNLPNIIDEVCPICKAIAISDRRDIGTHINGTYRQIRTFACEGVIEYSPAFGITETVYGCTNNPVYLAEKQKREAAKRELFSTLAKLNLNDELELRLQKEIEYILGTYRM